MFEPVLLVKPVASLEDTEKKQTFQDGVEERVIDATMTTTRRSVVLIPRSKSQAGSRRVTPTSTSPSADTLEKHLPNGDLYIGTFSNSTPHGLGKYLWKDGCMYEGEWKKGKASGKGKFSWPSGATFEGEFKSGRMEGEGTFIGADGDMYKGSWSADRKHGNGVKHYVNGDYYKGQWRRNLQDGQGRYVWRNGNEYNGEWRSGMIHGRGVLIWNIGNRYEGNWENGVPKEHGVFTWPDGSCYIGCWCKDFCKKTNNNQILNGTFYPSQLGNMVYEEGSKGFFSYKLSAPLLVVGEESLDVVAGGGVGKKRSSSAEGGVMERTLPRICIWESDGEAGDITCDIVDTLQPSYSDGFLMEQRMEFRKNPSFFNGEVRKPGLTIGKGHKNYDLMLNLQLGIRHSVGKDASRLPDLKLSDFDPKEKFWTRFPPEGSKTTPPHLSSEFRWKDYCPVVFR